MARDIIFFAVEDQDVVSEGARAGGGSVGAEVGLGEGDGEGGVGREVEFGVAFAPVSGCQLALVVTMYGNSMICESGSRGL